MTLIRCFKDFKSYIWAEYKV